VFSRASEFIPGIVANEIQAFRRRDARFALDEGAAARGPAG
jgi:hypothetical protein